MNIVNTKTFANGQVHAIRLQDGKLIETTDTFLPSYTKDSAKEHQNSLHTENAGDRTERWMIGVSVMSGCPVGCKFCATGAMNGWRNLTADEIVEQVQCIVARNKNSRPEDAFEFKINYTRMGEPFLNLRAVQKAIARIDALFPETCVHHYVSTIGIEGASFSWIKGSIILQISVHSLDEKRRSALIPYKKKMSLEALGKIRTRSCLKTTVNLTLVDTNDFDIAVLERYFDPRFFFIKLSPINQNKVSEDNKLGSGIIKATNLL